MTKGDHVIVIGGGIIGAMCGWYLRQSGHSVTIVDKNKYGAACSHGNCGYVCPSHVLPLPQPGAIKNALQTMLRPNSPLRVKFGFTPKLWRWLWNFYIRCNEKDMLRAATVRSSLLELSKQLYVNLVEGHDIDCEWKESGLLFVFKNAASFNHFAETDLLLRNEFGVEAEAISSKELTELEPALKTGLGGGWYYRGDCHLSPDKLMASLRENLQQSGVQFVENFHVERFVVESNRCKAISNGNETIEGDGFVVAAGAMTPFLNEHLGCNLQIQPGKGYSITMPRPKLCPKIPIILEEHRVAITPLDTKYRIGSTMEFAGYDTSISPNRLKYLKMAAEEYLHDPHCDPVEEKWYGWRPMTWDGVPIIDQSPLMNNTWVATGHNMLGISMGTGTGKLVQELIDDETPSLDPEPYSLSRFRR